MFIFVCNAPIHAKLIIKYLINATHHIVDAQFYCITP